jgi:hypothetical protein
MAEVRIVNTHKPVARVATTERWVISPGTNPQGTDSEGLDFFFSGSGKRYADKARALGIGESFCTPPAPVDGKRRTVKRVA